MSEISSSGSSSAWLNEFYTEQDTDQKTIDRQNNDYQNDVAVETDPVANVQSEADLFPQVAASSSDEINL
jgi:hypothetical protein